MLQRVAVVALDVEELFTAHVRAEARFGQDIAVLAHELQPNEVLGTPLKGRRAKHLDGSEAL